MRIPFVLIICECLLLPITITSRTSPHKVTDQPAMEQRIPLPSPRSKGPMSLEETLTKRRSVREYSREPISMEHLSQILWAAQGITSSTGQRRTAPSAGALYPLELYVAAETVDGIAAGLFRYDPQNHELIAVKSGHFLQTISAAALVQEAIVRAPLVLLICAVYERTTRKYGDRGIRYVHMEAGHAAQNAALQATALGLGTVPIGAFRDDEIRKTLVLRKSLQPLYIMPFGHPG